MSIDVDTLAIRAGEALRTQARTRIARLGGPGTDPLERRVRRRAVRRTVGAVVATAAVVVLVVVLAVRPGDVSFPAIEPARPDPANPVAQDGVLPVPPVRQAIAAYLDDGTPVFVSQPAEGDVWVLDAVDPKKPTLLAFCASSGWFEDPWHGSRFSGWGDWVGGPAPTGMLAYPIEVASDGETVRVLRPPRTAPAPARGDHRADGELNQPRGPMCTEGPMGEPRMTEHAEVHHVPADVPMMDGRDVRADGWAWVRLVLREVDGVVFACAPDGSCTQDAPPLRIDPDWFYLGAGLASIDGTVRVQLARETEPGTIETILPAERRLAELTPLGAPAVDRPADAEPA